MIYTDNDFHINYNIIGKGDTILFIHGLMDCSEVWDSISEKLSQLYQCITVDLPGHGYSKFLSNHCNLNTIAQSLYKLVRKETDAPFHIVGHSLGGYIGASISTQYQKDIASMVFVNSHPFTDNESKKKFRQKEINLIMNGKYQLLKDIMHKTRFVDGFTINFPDLYKKIHKYQNMLLPDNIVKYQKMMLLRNNLSINLLTSDIPLLFCLSKSDKQVDYKLITNAFSGNKHVNIHFFEQSNHTCFLEEQSQFLYVFQQFIKNLSSI
ncbi:MAG: alpha/beta hydrolase [Marinilabiliaceae bacterium]|nr:alpha/beta hydrolase [Marinilabiliaceae bacterium]